MSATLGDVTALREDLTRRTGRETALVDDAERPVPLHFSWSVEPLHELLEELVRADQAPVYVVHFTQASALERAQSLLSAKLCTREERDAIAERDRRLPLHRRASARRSPSSCAAGIGVHHAGHAAALPAARRAARPDRAAEGRSAGPTRSASASTSRSAPSSSPAWRSSTAPTTGC